MAGYHKDTFPRWLALWRSGELDRRAAAAAKMAAPCALCPRKCGTPRDRGATGPCGARSPEQAYLAGFLPHFGEEPPLVGSRGSGTVFFAGCGLRCIFCQNHQISQPPGGPDSVDWIEKCDPASLADKFLLLQKQGCHNLNLVTGTAHLPVILRALARAAEHGLTLPLVWNSGGYENLETLALLDRVVDIYLPDMKFGRRENAALLTGVGDYVRVSRAALKEMYRQVGLLRFAADGTARSGLIVRHLVLPGDLAGTRQVLLFLKQKLSTEIHLSLMAQYYPAHQAGKVPSLNRPLTREEYKKTERCLARFGFKNGWVQETASRDLYQPDFTRSDPFHRNDGAA